MLGQCLCIPPRLPILLPPPVCFLFMFQYGQELAPCSFTQASWHFCLTSYSLGWTTLDLHGDDLWILTGFGGPLFSPGPHTLSPHQRDWGKNQLYPHALNYCPSEVCSHFWYCPGFPISLAMKVESRGKNVIFSFTVALEKSWYLFSAIVVSLRCSKLT